MHGPVVRTHILDTRASATVSNNDGELDGRTDGWTVGGGERGEFSRKLSLRRDDNGNPIEAVHLRRVMVAVWYFNWRIAINPAGRMIV